MPKTSHILVHVGVTLLFLTPTANADEQHAAHRLVARKAIEGLAPDIRPVFEANRAAFINSAVEPGDGWTRDRAMNRRKRWHELEADVSADAQNLEARMRAFDAFPRNEREAQRLYRRSSGRNGGRLPWAVAELHQQLIESLRIGDTTQAIQYAGHLTHFVTDAANPFRVTANHHGQLTDNPTYGATRSVHPDDADHSVRERFNVGLLSRYAGTYDPDIHISEDASTRFAEPLSAAFGLIELSLSVVDHVAKTDREAITALGITDSESFAANRTDYLKTLDENCGDIAVSQLSAAASTTAQLINSAWISAGKPTLNPGSGAPDATSNAKPTGVASLTGASFVGSKNSNVFHKPNCRFAKQISSENLVTYPSAVAARKDARRGCRSCEPE